MKNLGTFKVESGKVVVADPCYTLDTWCIKVLDNVAKGEWEAQIDEVDGGMFTDEGTSVSELRVFHKETEIKLFEWELVEDAVVGVDSGQAGFFDLPAFKTGNDEVWYDMVCDKTNPAATIEGGVVSTSGWGDGTYPLRVKRELDGTITGISVTFLDDPNHVDSIDELDLDTTCD